MEGHLQREFPSLPEVDRRPAAAYAAGAWAFVFAAMSFYWALGGSAGVGTQAVAIQEQIDDPQFVAILWATGALKVAAGAIALALARPPTRTSLRRALVAAAWVATGALLLYGGGGWIQALLWELGVQDIPESVGAKAARWKLIFWEPFWLLGGFLFLRAVRRIPGRGSAVRRSTG